MTFRLWRCLFLHCCNFVFFLFCICGSPRLSFSLQNATECPVLFLLPCCTFVFCTFVSYTFVFCMSLLMLYFVILLFLFICIFVYQYLVFLLFCNCGSLSLSFSLQNATECPVLVKLPGCTLFFVLLYFVCLFFMLYFVILLFLYICIFVFLYFVFFLFCSCGSLRLSFSLQNATECRVLF